MKSVTIIATLIAVSSIASADKTILDVLKSNGFGMLAASFSNAGLVDRLSGPGPLTVFAPSKAAFLEWHKRPTVVEYLKNSDPQEVIADVLLGHIVEGEVKLPSTSTEFRVKTLAGNELLFDCFPDQKICTVNGFNVEMSPMVASNGLVFPTDGLLKINREKILTYLTQTRKFSIFIEVIKAVGLLDELKAMPGPITMLAPTNDAFKSLPPSFVMKFKGNIAEVKKMLKGHIINKKQFQKRLMSSPIQTLAETYIKSSMNGDVMMIGDAKIIEADIPASDGVIHIIDKVLV